jgi:hypothetical protein
VKKYCNKQQIKVIIPIIINVMVQLIEVFKNIEATIGKTIDPAPITANPATLVNEASKPRCFEFLVLNGINVLFAVLYIG